MADYTTITDAQVDPEAPITSELMSALRDNPIAITEGASGAPQIQNAAIATNAVTIAKLNIGTRSFSGSVDAGGSVSIALSDLYAFIPTYSLENQLSIRFRSGSSGYTISSAAGVSRAYSLSWRYLSA